jgi:hypothetical protein
MALLFGAVAADLHFAPSPTPALGPIDEHPATFLALALLDAREIGLKQRRKSGKGDRAEHGLDGRAPNSPAPDEIALERDEFRLG